MAIIEHVYILCIVTVQSHLDNIQYLKEKFMESTYTK